MIVSVVAKNARQIMKDRGLKHGAVAEKAGFSAKQFSALMTGRRVIKDTDVVALANALDVSPNTLFGIEAKENSRT